MRLKLLFLFSIVSIISYSQNRSKTDSLYKVLSFSKEDTNKVNTLIKICNNYYSTNLDSLEKFASQAEKLSRKIEFNKGIASSLYYLSFYNEQKGNPNKAIDISKMALSYLSSNNNSKIAGKLYGNIAGEYLNMGNVDSGMFYMTKSVQVQEFNHDSLGLIYSYIGMGRVYDDQGKYMKAVSYYSLALKIAELRKDSSEIAYSYWAISRPYCELGFYNLALKYDLKSIAINERLGGNFDAALGYETLSIIYLNGFKDLNKAEQAMLKELSLCKLAGVEQRNAIIYSSLANIYLQKNENDQAEKYEKMAIQFNEKIGDKNEQINSLLNLGSIYINQNRIVLAIENLKKCIALAQTIGRVDYILVADSLLSKAFYLSTDYKEAYDYRILEDHLKDSLFTEKNKKGMIEVQAKYETEKKDKELALQKANLNEQNAQLEKQGIIIYSAFSGVGLLVVIITLIVMINRRNKLKLKSDEERKKIEFKNKLMDLEQKALRSQMNPHFIFNALNSIQGYIATNDSEEATALLAKFAKLMRLILDNSREKIIPLENEIKMLQYYLELQQLSYTNKFNFKIELDAEIDVENIGIPPMLIQPFVENAIVHGIANKVEGGNIILRIKLLGEYLQIEIEDDGVGRERALIQKKQLDTIHKSVGLLITKERIDIFNEEHQQQIKVDVLDLKDEKGNSTGTKGILQFPMQHLYN